MNVRLVQLDGKYPNLALMKLAHYHRANGDRELLILCNHHESFWTAHRNYGFLFSCDSAEEGANKVNAELCRERTWARQSDKKFSLVAAKISESRP